MIYIIVSYTNIKLSYLMIEILIGAKLAWQQNCVFIKFNNAYMYVHIKTLHINKTSNLSYNNVTIEL